MRVAVLLALTVLLPLVSVAVARVSVPESALLPLVGRWFVFWAAGLRLFLDGAGQLFRRRAAGFRPEAAVAALAIGATGLMAVHRTHWTPAAAMAGGIFLGGLALVRLAQGGRSRAATAGAAGDLFAAAMLGVYLASRAV